MTETPLGTIIDMLLVVIVMFLFPVIWMAQKSDYLVNTQAQNATNEFITNVCERGYLDEEMYKAFMTNLSAGGTVYSVDMEHRQTVFEPEYAAGAFTGNVMEYEKEQFTDTILETIYDKGAYLLDKGDTFKVTITLAGEGLAQTFTMSLLGAKTSGYYSNSMMVTGLSEDFYNEYLAR